MRGGAVPAIHGRRDSPPVPRRHDGRPLFGELARYTGVGEAMPDKRYGKRRVKSVAWPTSWLAPGARWGLGQPLGARRPAPPGASRRARRCRKRRERGTSERRRGVSAPDQSARRRATREEAVAPPSPVVSSSSPRPVAARGRGRSRPAPPLKATVGGRASVDTFQSPAAPRETPPGTSGAFAHASPSSPPDRKAVLFPAPPAVSRSPLPLLPSPAFSGCRGEDRNGRFRRGAARLRPPPRARPPSGRS